MKFDCCVGNPPYQGDNHKQIYPDFYLAGQTIANTVEMIFPTGWQAPKNANNLKQMNNTGVKEDRQIVFIDNRHNVFNAVAGAEWTNILLWKKGFDNGLDGKQRILTDGQNEIIKKLVVEKSEVEKPKEIVALKNIVVNSKFFSPFSDLISSLKPYGLRTDFLDNQEKYNLPSTVQNSRTNENDILIYGLKGRSRVVKYLPHDYPIPKQTQNYEKHKVLVGKAWGGPSERYVGGSFADIIIALPYQICTENYLEIGGCDSYDTAKKQSKYIMTRFCRALLFANKHTHDNSKDKWVSVPVQDYHEEWWSKSIAEIDKELMKKYNVPQDVQDFIFANVQERTEGNIVNYK